MPLSINIDSFVPKIDINMNQILFQKGKMKIKLQVCIFEEDEVFISYAPALDLSAFGNTEDEAKREFEQTLHEYITYCLHKKTLERDLLEHGWIVKKKKDSIFKNSEIPLVLYQNAKMYSCEDQDLLDLFKQLAPELVKRKEMLEKYCQENDLNFNNPSTTRKTFDFMYEHTQPIFVMFESFLDICFNTNEQILKGLKGYLQIARKYNIYFLGCFYPNDARQLKMDSFFNEFMNEKLIMLFGGNYDKQDLIQELPVEFYKVNKDIQFNKCIMQYRGKIYSLQMPCGSLKEEIYHEDELSIF